MIPTFLYVFALSKGEEWQGMAARKEQLRVGLWMSSVSKHSALLIFAKWALKMRTCTVTYAITDRQKYRLSHCIRTFPIGYQVSTLQVNVTARQKIRTCLAVRRVYL